MALTEMVPNLIWAPDFFGPEKFWPQEVWSLRNMEPKKFGTRMKIITWHFHAGPKHLRPKFLGDQISWEPNFLGTKFLGDPKSQGPK